MQGPARTGKSVRASPGNSIFDKQAHHARRAGANRDLTSGQASEYTLALYLHAHTKVRKVTFHFPVV
jgi:hypothetical protein